MNVGGDVNPDRWVGGGLSAVNFRASRQTFAHEDAAFTLANVVGNLEGL